MDLILYPWFVILALSLTSQKTLVIFQSIQMPQFDCTSSEPYSFFVHIVFVYEKVIYL